jgi:sulfite reductase alpha subunit-like flavoprotein
MLLLLLLLLQVLLLNMEDFDRTSWADSIGAAAAVLLLSSTYGPGSPPAAATKFISWLGECKESSGARWETVWAGGQLDV